MDVGSIVNAGAAAIASGAAVLTMWRTLRAGSETHPVSAASTSPALPSTPPEGSSDGSHHLPHGASDRHGGVEIVGGSGYVSDQPEVTEAEPSSELGLVLRALEGLEPEDRSARLRAALASSEELQGEYVSRLLAMHLSRLPPPPPPTELGDTQERELPVGWVEAMDILPPLARNRLAMLLSDTNQGAEESIRELLGQLNDKASAAKERILQDWTQELSEQTASLTEPRRMTAEESRLETAAFARRLLESHIEVNHRTESNPLRGSLNRMLRRDLRRLRDPRRNLHDEPAGDLPDGWALALDALSREDRDRLIRFLSHPPLAHQAILRVYAFLYSVTGDDGALSLPNPGPASERLVRNLRVYLGAASPTPNQRGAASPPLKHVADAPVDLLPAERAEAAVDAGRSIDHALAMLFIRLGPPPEESNIDDYTPASSGGGGARQ